MNDYLFQTFVENFPLLFVSIGMIFFIVYGRGLKSRASLCAFLIIVCSLVLMVLVSLKKFIRVYSNGPVEARVFFVNLLGLLSYVLRPIALFFFILLADDFIHELSKKKLLLLLVPLFINTFVYLIALIPPVGNYIVNWIYSEGNIHFHPGSFLRYTAHVVAGFYLAYLIYISFKKIKSNRIEDAIILIALIVFSIAAIIIESVTEIDYLVNYVICASCVFYYLFIYNHSMRRDPLTGLLSRASYFRDVVKYNRVITAVVELDMNGLKYFNDTFGHAVGDEALICVANIIANNVNKKYMFSYRLGGDEFLILAIKTSKEAIEEVCKKIRTELTKTKYSASIGYAHVMTVNSDSVDELIKQAEKMMYEDKDDFYATSEITRRKI